jgi:hypothetical protein
MSFGVTSRSRCSSKARILVANLTGIQCTFCNVQKAIHNKAKANCPFISHYSYSQRNIQTLRNPSNPPGIPAHEAAKIQAFFDYKRSLEAKHAYSYDRIINMDETPVYFNNPSKKTVHYGLTKDPVAVKVMEGTKELESQRCWPAQEPVILHKSPCIVECSKNKAARTDAGYTRYEREGGVSCWKQENNTVNSSIMVDWVDNWQAPR